MGKNVSLEIAGLPRSSSSDSTCPLLVGLIGERMRDGAAEVSAEGLVVTEIEFDLGEGDVYVSFGTEGFGVTPLESGLKVDDTLRNARTFFPNETNESEGPRGFNP